MTRTPRSRAQWKTHLQRPGSLMTHRAHVLLVEDEKITAALTERVLKEHGYQVTMAADGESAWNRLKGGAGFDAVLLDLGLPDIDGMVLLQRIKADPNLRRGPVIIVISRNDLKTISDTLTAGARYHLSKSRCKHPTRWRRCAIAEQRERHAMQKQLGEAAQSMGLLESGTVRYSTMAQEHRLACRQAQACADPARSWLGLQELLINAVEHGNLGISYAEKSLLMLENRLHEEIERRAQDPACSQLQVSVHLLRDADGLSLTIQDQGQGFAWQD